MSSSIPLPRKAVVILGFNAEASRVGAAPAVPYGALAEHLPAADRLYIQEAVEEALAAGLSELIFVTQDGFALLDMARGLANDSLPLQLVVPRQKPALGLGQALRGARSMIGEEPFVVLTLGQARSIAGGVLRQLLAAYRRVGGNLVVVTDAEVLHGQGTFAAIDKAAVGHCILQPDIFKALDDDPEGDLAAALLAQAEIWPVTALPLRGGSPDAGGRPQEAEAMAGAAR